MNGLPTLGRIITWPWRRWHQHAAALNRHWRTTRWRMRTRRCVPSSVAPRIAIGLVEHLGDIVACEPVIRFLRRQYPDAHLTWCVRPAYRCLLEHHPQLDAVLPLFCLTEWIRLRETAYFDQYVDLHLPGRLCLGCLLPLVKTEGDKTITLQNYYHHGALLQVLSRSAGLPPLSEPPRLFLPPTAKRRIDRLRLPPRFVVIHAVSNDEKRNWNQTRWTDLARFLTAHLEVPVVEIGLASEVRASGMSNYRSLCGQLSIPGSAEVIRRATLFVGVDSGPAHLANAWGTPGVVLLGRFGPFQDHIPYTGPYSDPAFATLIHSGHATSEMALERVQQVVADRLVRLLGHPAVASKHA